MKSKNKKYTYIFATDTLLESNKYSKNFTTINNAKKIEMLISSDNHMYELITKTNVKIYFDIDNLDLTREHTDQFLKDFVSIINTELNIQLTLQDIIVMCNDKKNKKTGEYSDNIHSLHIIIPSYKMFKAQQKLFTKYLNDKYDEVWEKYTSNDVFDTAVYNANNQFRMINQSKLSNNIKLVDYNNSVINSNYIKKSRINYVYKTTELAFFKTINPFEKFSNVKQLKELADDELVDFILTNDSIDNKKLMNRNRIWKLMTRLILKHTILYDINKWCEKSAEIANNPHFTAEKNKEYIELIKNEETFAETYSLFKIINEYSNKYNVYSQNQDIQYHTQEFLKEHFEDYNTIIENILLYKNDISTDNQMEAKMKNNGDCVINLKTGFIVCSNTQIYNMYCDNISVAKETLFDSVKDIDEAKVKLNEVIDNPNKNVMVLKSRWGTGKTHHIINELISHYESNNIKVLMITESNALNSKLCEDYGFVSHQDDKYKNPNTLDRNNKVVCSIQSLHRLVNTDYDILVVDEIQSILNAYSSSSTFKNLPHNLKAYNMYDLLIQKIKDSNKSLLCDADIQQNYIEALTEQLGKDNMEIVKNTQLAFSNYKIKIYTDYTDILNHLTKKILHTDSKIAIASASRAKIDEYIVDINKLLIENKVEKKIIAVISSYGVKLYSNGIENTNNIDKQETLKNIDKFVIDNDVDLLFYSPTIKTGISFNTKDYFDYTFAFGECNSIVFCEFLQMLFRVRNLRQKEILVYLKESQFFCGKNSNLNETKYLQKIKNNVFKKLTSHIDIYDDECSEEYKKIQTINLNVLQNTKYNYNQNLIMLLKYHKLQYQYILPANYDEVCEEKLNDIEQAKIVLRNRECNEWLEIPIMDIKVFFGIKKDIGENKIKWDDIDDDDKQSYSKTKQLYIIHNITENNIEDFYLEDEVIPKTIINTDAQNKIDICNNPDFFCKYIYKKRFKDVDFVRNIYCDKSIINADYNQEDEKQNINNKLTIRELIDMFELFEENNIFKTKTLTNQEFKNILIANTETIQKWFEMINIKKKNATFQADNDYHIKQIYHFVKNQLSNIDIQLKYLDAKHTNYQSKSNKAKGGKMVFKQTKQFIVYNENKDLTIKPSSSINHIPNQAIPFPKISKINDRLVYIEKNKTTELLDDNKVKKLQKQLDAGETLEKRIMKKYLYSKIVQEYKPYTDTDKLNEMIKDTPFYNAGFNMTYSMTGNIKLDYTDCEIYLNKGFFLKEYIIHTNSKTKQDYIITNTKKRTKMYVYETDIDVVKPYTSKLSKKVQILKERVKSVDELEETMNIVVEINTISCKA